MNREKEEKKKKRKKEMRQWIGVCPHQLNPRQPLATHGITAWQPMGSRVASSANEAAKLHNQWEHFCPQPEKLETAAEMETGWQNALQESLFFDGCNILPGYKHVFPRLMHIYFSSE